MAKPGARRARVCDRFGIDAEATWTPVPHALRKIAKDRGLSLAAYAVLIEVLDAYQPVFAGRLPFSASAVERLLPISRRHAGAAIEELAAAGLFKIERPNGGRLVLHVEQLLTALRLECSRYRRTGHLPLLRHEAGVAAGRQGTRQPGARDPAAGRQGAGGPLPAAGCAEVPDGRDARAAISGEREHVAAILASLKLGRRAAN